MDRCRTAPKHIRAAQPAAAGSLGNFVTLAVTSALGLVVTILINIYVRRAMFARWARRAGRWRSKSLPRLIVNPG